MIEKTATQRFCKTAVIVSMTALCTVSGGVMSPLAQAQSSPQEDEPPLVGKELEDKANELCEQYRQEGIKDDICNKIEENGIRFYDKFDKKIFGRGTIKGKNHYDIGPEKDNIYFKTDTYYCTLESEKEKNEPIEGNIVYFTENGDIKKSAPRDDGTTFSRCPIFNENVGSIDVQSVGDYSSQEGHLPDKNNVAHLQWDIHQYNGLHNVEYEPEAPYKQTQESVLSFRPKIVTNRAPGLVWVFVPEELSNISINEIGQDSKKKNIKVNEGMPDNYSYFFNGNEKTAWTIPVEKARQGILKDTGLTPEDDRYKVIAIPSLSEGDNTKSISLEGDMDTTGSSSDVYVPLRATHRLSTFSPGDGKMVVFSNTTLGTGGLPGFSVNDKAINDTLGKDYQDKSNSTAGLITNSDQCSPTVNIDSKDRLAKFEDIAPEKATKMYSENLEKIREETAKEFAQKYNKHDIFLYNEGEVNEDGCDQSAHRVLLQEKNTPPETPNTPRVTEGTQKETSQEKPGTSYASRKTPMIKQTKIPKTTLTSSSPTAPSAEPPHYSGDNAGPVVNTGGKNSLSFWQKIKQIF